MNDDEFEDYLTLLKVVGMKHGPLTVTMSKPQKLIYLTELSFLIEQEKRKYID